MLINLLVLEVLLFAIYLFLFTWVVARTGFFVNSGISRSQLALLFLLKVMAGIIYGWIGIYDGTIAHMSDTWAAHFNSLKETQLLFQHPRLYFTNIFQNANVNDLASFFSSHNSYWNNLKANAYIKIVSIFNCFSYGNYYINVIFYSYITFWGMMAIYKVMKHEIKANERVLITGCFLVPSFLYWCSGLHKDGFAFLAVAIIIYQFYFFILKGKAKFGSYLAMAFGLFLLFVFRNHILVILIPALAAWLIAEKMPKYRFKIFAAIYTTGIVMFFGLRYLAPSLDFPTFVVEKQQAFNKLKGGKTSVPVNTLEPTAKSFFKTMPQAISLSVLRPYPSDVYKPIILPAFIELIIIWALLILSISFRRKNSKITPFVLFISFFTISMLFIIGYTVNNLGATARYRSFLFPLFVPLVLNAIDWIKLCSLIYKK